uniref:Alpha 1,4-glycosyltransferase domain-containing protein n=1 Tax=Pseudo-nitzschia australis TaxID=44445 RepID=A0A7S4AJP2_9STRA|eukprot:CAMPEP_0168196258 /NCGR_PEP_ID=MMETSP0139_2-20121125/20401_1 /TAXON_ID=44445 /ORGANISM="Pseudo-nitzschia australis, Strain 10249 10 AB" /LENGTH=850 /DNA_ID=CAMNT_0008120383 /DNA_START=253 /DNA_END=2805 /DNA_ORIENTATION=-
MEIRHRKNNRAFTTQKKAATVALGALVCCIIGYHWGPEWGSPVIDDDYSSFSNKGNKVYNNSNGVGIPVFYPIYTYAKKDGTAGTTARTTTTGTSASPVTDKLVEDLRHSPSVSEVIGLDAEHPPAFLDNCGINGNGIAVVAASGVEFGTSTSASTSSSTAKKRFDLLKASKQPHLAMELLKYCALEHYGGGLYLDSQSTLSTTLDHALSQAASSGSGNLAVLNDSKISPESIHGGILCITGEYQYEYEYEYEYGSDSSRSKQSSSKKKGKKSAFVVVEGMIRLLLSTELSVLESSPLFLPKSLYTLIAKDMGAAELSSASTEPPQSESSWYLLQHTCSLFSLGQRQLTAPISPYALNSHRLTQNCPEPSGFCCSIYDPITYTPTMMTKHLLLPYQILPPTSDLPKPLNADKGEFDEADLPYISTVSERVHPRPKGEALLTPNFFETLLQNDCLPSDKKCSDCLRNKQGSSCKTCASACPCYCKTLCHISVEEKFVSKSLVVSPPVYAKEPSRLIPRIVHQTYYEAVTSEKYPNMSRLIESFKQSGWEYKFYTDEMSLNFLSTHFPSEVREAYETLRPGAFKADLFRYCVLLIHGGVYADMDIMLETNLDLAIGPDIGFMVPQDEPGTPVNRRMCLWNGFIAAAPGHPFLAKTIETVVNNIRNRFTSVDTDSMFCPNPELSMLHSFDTLFTAGPCILGAMVNKVLGRHGQTSFEAGEIDMWERSKQDALQKGTEFVIGVDDKPSKKIPGRTIILHQNKWDMGSHRFTFLEKNLVVAATDLPGADDRANQESPKEHYSKTHVKAGIYGLDRLYTDNIRANEELRFYVDAQWSRYVKRGIRDLSGTASTSSI